MLDQSFTTKNFCYLLKRRDFAKYKLKVINDEYKTTISDIATAIDDNLILDSSFTINYIHSKPIFSYSSFHNELVVRKLNDNIRRIYGIKQSDRNTIIKQISCYLEDSVPISILKLDIKNYYESINREAIVSKLLSDQPLSTKSKIILRQIFNNDDISKISGLPRGLALSASLSEIYMRPFDKFVKSIDGVYFYSRYVDDIIILSHKDIDKIKLDIDSYLLDNLKMTLNNDKSKLLKVYCRCDELCKCSIKSKCDLLCKCNLNMQNVIDFDYLGYKFSTCLNSKPYRTMNDVKISLADNKVRKLKSRVILALLDYCKNHDFKMLENRFRYLTGNFSIDASDRMVKIKSGIYYNYQHTNTTESYTNLDTFLYKSLYSKSGSLGKKLNANISKKDRNRLSKYKFSSGHEKKIYYSFTPKDIALIKECWKT